MLHRDTGENLSALDPRDTQGLFIISTWSSHLWLSLESIKLPHFPGTWHRHLCLYEMQRTQSRVLQIGPCCSSSEVQDFNFYHIFFYHLSPFSHLPPFLRNSWGYKNATLLQTLIEFLSSQPSVQGSCPGWGNFPLQYREKKQRERGKSFKPFSGQEWNHRRRSSLSIQERSEEKVRKIPNVVHGSCKHLTVLTCWVVKEVFSIPSVFIFLLRALYMAEGGKEK